MNSAGLAPGCKPFRIAWCTGGGNVTEELKCASRKRDYRRRAPRLAVATLLPLLLPILCSAQQLTPAEALDRYLAKAGGPQPASSDSVFTVQIDASIPTLHRQGSMTGLKLVSYTGQVVYRGLRFTGDKLVKTAVIARFLSNDTESGSTDCRRRCFTPELLVHLQQDIGLQRAYRVRVSPEAPAQTGRALSRRVVADYGYGCAFAAMGRSCKVTLHLHPQFPHCAGLPNGCGVLPAAPPGADNPHANCRHSGNGRMAAFRRRLAGIYWRRRE